MDWQHEWLTSLTSTAVTCVVTILVGALMVWLLTRYPHWGRQFRRLAFPYLKPGRGWITWRPLLTLLLLLWLTVLEVRLEVLMSYATNGLYTALQGLNAKMFWFCVTVFMVLAVIIVSSAQLAYLITQRLFIHWRTWLNDHMIADWLDGHAYHRGQFVSSPVDNPDQRIEEDVTQFVENSYDLSIGAIGAALRLVSFTAILWGLSGPIPVFGHEIPRAMVFLAYIYVIMASVLAFRIGRPLIHLNFLREGLSASFRYALVRLRDNSESIAFYGGENVERTVLSARFSSVMGNTWAITKRSLKLQVFNDAVTQISVVFPFIIQVPRFFSGTISLGDITQTADAFGQVHDSLSFFRNAYDSFATYRATLNRLTALMDANRESRDLSSPIFAHLSRHAGDRGSEGMASRQATVDRGPDAEHEPRAGAAGQGSLGEREDHVAAQPGQSLAARPWHRPPAHRSSHALPVAAAVSAPGKPAYRAGLPRARAPDRRRAGVRGVALGTARPPAGSDRRRGPLVAHPVSRRAAAPRFRQGPAAAAPPGLPRRGDLRRRRRSRTRVVQLDPRSPAPVHSCQRRSSQHVERLPHPPPGTARRGTLGHGAGRRVGPSGLLGEERRSGFYRRRTPVLG